MKPFLQIVSENIYSQFKDDLSKLCIVFPNRRAALYFNKYLSVQIDKPVWTPAYYTINEFFQKYSNFQLADDLYLIFNLYQVYKKIKKTEESFDNFYHWGEMLLNDFDEIDKNLINPKDLFQNLKNLKAIHESFQYLTDEQLEAIRSYWQSFNIDQYSKHQQDFISVWEILYTVYSQFKEMIKEDNYAFEGMIYREVVDNIDNINFNQYEKYIFIGFNALNECEKKVFHYLKNSKKALFYWDYDEYYLENKIHEAGYFLRKNIVDFPNSISDDIYSNLMSEKKIDFISVSSDIAQVGVINNIIKEYNNIGINGRSNSVIVLADEQLLIPTLHNIPDEIEDINVSMGYPLLSTPVYSLFENLVNLQKNIKENKNGFTVFYYNDIISVLNHQYIKLFISDDFHDSISELIQQNRIYIQKSDLKHSELTDFIFTKQESTLKFTEYILEIFRRISLKINELDKSEIVKGLEREFIYSLYLAIKRLDDIIKKYKVELKLETYIRLLRKIIRNIRIPFVGEPLKGLQILGILETRTIDFENIIILSSNEGILPKVRVASSFIPYNLRRGFGLPTVKNQDSIYAYYFYRIIQRAKNISLVYSTKTDVASTGEMSRFLYQMKYNKDFKINELNFDYSITPLKIRPIQVLKNEKILDKLYQISGNMEGKYLSPSALNTYIDCRLRFYFKYIVGIDEFEEIHEEVEAVDFGNILHSTIQELYNPYLNKNVSEEILDKIRNDKDLIEKVVENAFQNEYYRSKSIIEITGSNLIIKEIIIKYVKQILEMDKKYIPIVPLSLEDKYIIKQKVNEHEIYIGGKIDRIDKINGQVRITDYKTGKGELSFGEIDKLFIRENENRNKAAFQAFLYSYLYSKIKQDNNIMPSLYFVLDLFKNDFSYKLKMKDGKLNVSINSYMEIKKDFEENLFNLLCELLNPEIPFSQIENTKICQYCPYKIVCQR